MLAASATRMIINISPDLEATLNALARPQGTTPEEVALKALRERFLNRVQPFEPQDEWERRLFSAATDCGVSLSNEALSSDGLYE